MLFQRLSSILAPSTSEHTSLLLFPNPWIDKMNQLQQPFEFEKMCYHNLNFDDQIKGWWNKVADCSDAAQNLVYKLWSLLAKLKQWNRLHFGNMTLTTKAILDGAKLLDTIEKDRSLTTYCGVQKMISLVPHWLELRKNLAYIGKDHLSHVRRLLRNKTVRPKNGPYNPRAMRPPTLDCELWGLQHWR